MSDKKALKKYVPLIVIALVFLVGIALISMSRADTGQKKQPAAAAPRGSDGHAHTDGHTDHAHPEEAGTPLVDLTAQSQVGMDIRNYAFAQPNIKIRKGTTVTWTNRDVMLHNVMEEHDNSGRGHEPPAPTQVRPDVFSGPMLQQGETYSFTFNETGTLSYHCAPHPNMVGYVTVVE